MSSKNNTTFQSKKTNSTDTQFWPQPTTVLLRTTPTRTINQTKTSVTANNNPSQDYSNPDDQPTTNVSHNQQQSFSVLHQPRQSTNHKRQTQPTTVLLRTTPTTNVSHNQQQSFSVLHQPRQSTNHKRQTQPTTVLLRTSPTLTINQPKTSATANNSPSQDYSNHKRQSQPTTVLLSITPAQAINQPQTSDTTNNSPSQYYTNPDNQPTTNVRHNQQQFFSGLHQP